MSFFKQFIDLTESSSSSTLLRRFLLNSGSEDLTSLTVAELKEIAKKEGFRPMSDMGREMILSGDLSIREFDRVLSSE